MSKYILATLVALFTIMGTTLGAEAHHCWHGWSGYNGYNGNYGGGTFVDRLVGNGGPRFFNNGYYPGNNNNNWRNWNGNWNGNWHHHHHHH